MGSVESRLVLHRFFDDYSEGVHPELLRYITAHNEGQQEGYGRDEACELASRRIVARLGREVDSVHFVAGATQANLIGISSMLRDYEGIIAPTSGHIAVHEAGAVEATGHKIVTIEAEDGKLTPDLVARAAATHQDEHTVRPAAVFVTQATEMGTVYRFDELAAVVRCAKDLRLRVFLDGARLSMGLGSRANDMDMDGLVRTGVDMFTIGGTKVGAMFGEAIVIVDQELGERFRYRLKQRGALLAKGRFLGLQFARFFDDDDLWFRLGHQSNVCARQLATGLESLGLSTAYPCETNQVFVVLPATAAASLAEDFGFHDWGPWDSRRRLVRFVCSWATPESAVAELLDAVSRLL
jgi:threonine aldolase